MSAPTCMQVDIVRRIKDIESLVDNLMNMDIPECDSRVKDIRLVEKGQLKLTTRRGENKYHYDTDAPD